MEKEALNACIALAQKGDGDAFSVLLNKYDPLIKATVSRTMSKMPELTDTDAEDLHQEAVLAFYSALMTYDFLISDVEFGLYAKVCIRNRLVSLARKQQGQVSSVAFQEEDGGEGAVQNPEQRIVEQENYRELLRRIDTALSDLEKKVLSLYLSQVSYAQIAERLNVSEKTVDNAICRLKAKLKRYR